jgi:G patch domain-containing protein 1
LRQRRLQDLQATTGRMLTGDDVTLPQEDDEEAGKHTYAPRDTPVLVVDRKDNFHGLGYRPGMSLNESLGKGSGTTSSGPNISGGYI